jgi:micrococcal nuclease
MLSILRRTGVALVIAASTIAVGCTRRAEPGDGAAIVTHVVDGDTIDVEFGDTEERVRLIGIDTPETKKPNTPIECWGPEASAHTAELLPPGTAVRIARDVVGRDDYGRILGYVYRASDDVFVNLEIIENGFAIPLTIEPNSTFAATFVDAARRAERDDIGMWKACTDAGR